MASFSCLMLGVCCQLGFSLYVVSHSQKNFLHMEVKEFQEGKNKAQGLNI